MQPQHGTPARASRALPARSSACAFDGHALGSCGLSAFDGRHVKPCRGGTQLYEFRGGRPPPDGGGAAKGGSASADSSDGSGIRKEVLLPDNNLHVKHLAYCARQRVETENWLVPPGAEWLNCSFGCPLGKGMTP